MTTLVTDAAVRCVRFLATTALLLLACVCAASADSFFAVSDSAGVYLIDSGSGTVLQTYGATFAGTNTQDLAEDLSGNLYDTDSAGNLWMSAPPYASATNMGQVKSTSPAISLTAAVPRLGFDTQRNQLVTMAVSGSTTYLLYFSPATPGNATALALNSNIGNGGGDLVSIQDAAGHTTVYVVAQQNLYSVDGSTGAVTGPMAITGLGTGNLTGLTATAAGQLIACQQIGSGTPWKLWTFAKTGGAATQVGPAAGITTGSDVVNDLASVPAVFTAGKTGTAQGGPGDSVTYYVTVKNTGYATYPSAMMKDPVPAGITISSVTPPTCSVAGGGSCAITSAAGAQTVIAQVTNLAPGATATLTVVGTPTATSGSATNTASVSVPYDPNGTGGGDTISSPGVTTTYTPANLAKTVTNVTRSLGPGTNVNASPGDVLEYTLTLTNRRGFAMQALSVDDAIPPNTTYVASSATCVTTPGTLTCTPSFSAGTVHFTYSGGSLATNGTVTVKFRVTVN